MRIDRGVSKSGAYKERLIKKNVRIIKTSTEPFFFCSCYWRGEDLSIFCLIYFL